MKELKSWEQFQKLNEIKLPILKIDEILDGVSPIKKETEKRILVSYYKTYDEYIDIADKKKHHFKVHDLAGDIMNNNRVSFDVVIFNKEDLELIKKNIIDYSVGEFYSLLPSSINVFGLDMKPSSFVNKEELKFTFEQSLITEEVNIIIANVLGYNFEKQFNDYFIWSNKPIKTQVQQTTT